MKLWMGRVNETLVAKFDMSLRRADAHPEEVDSNPKIPKKMCSFEVDSNPKLVQTEIRRTKTTKLRRFFLLRRNPHLVLVPLVCGGCVGRINETLVVAGSG